MPSFLKLRDGFQIYYVQDLVDNPKAIVLINHGFAEHSDRYKHIVKRFNDLRYSVYRYDLRGHGRNKSELGHIESFNDLIEDTNEIINLIKNENKDTPVFMLGHSMGGLITALYGITYPDVLRGQIFSGSALGYLPAVEGIKKYPFLLLKLFLRNKMVKNPINDALCSDKQVFYEYLKDELVLKEATINFYVEFLIKSIEILNQRMKEYKYPCFITHGDMDKIVPKKHSINFYNSISSIDKEIKIYDNLYHEILNEKEKDRIIDDIISWIDKRI